MTTRSFLEKFFTYPCDTDIQISNDIRVQRNKKALMNRRKSILALSSSDERLKS